MKNADSVQNSPKPGQNLGGPSRTKVLAHVYLLGGKNDSWLIQESQNCPWPRSSSGSAKVQALTDGFFPFTVFVRWILCCQIRSEFEGLLENNVLKKPLCFTLQNLNAGSTKGRKQPVSG